MAIASVQQPKLDPGSGHVPIFLCSQVPDGLAMCLVCWRVIEASCLGTQPCGEPGKAVA
jgi:hypothetical protein